MLALRALCGCEVPALKATSLLGVAAAAAPSVVPFQHVCAGAIFRDGLPPGCSSTPVHQHQKPVHNPLPVITDLAHWSTPRIMCGVTMGNLAFYIPVTRV